MMNFLNLAIFNAFHGKKRWNVGKIIKICVLLGSLNFAGVPKASSFSSIDKMAIYDEAFNELMRDILKVLKKKIPHIPEAIDFILIRDHEMNAFTYGGQSIFVFTALLKNIPDFGAFLAIMLHEVGHIVLGHGISQHSRYGKIPSLLMTLAGAALTTWMGATGVQGLMAGHWIAQSHHQASHAFYRRIDESCADAFSYRALELLGWGGDCAADSIEILMKKYFANVPLDYQPFLSHPLLKDRWMTLRRQQRSLAFSDEKKIPKNALLDSLARKHFQQRYRLLVLDYHLRFLPMRELNHFMISLHPLEKAYAKGIYYYRKQQWNLALQSLKDFYQCLHWDQKSLESDPGRILVAPEDTEWIFCQGTCWSKVFLKCLEAEIAIRCDDRLKAFSAAQYASKMKPSWGVMKMLVHVLIQAASMDSKQEASKKSKERNAWVLTARQGRKIINFMEVFLLQNGFHQKDPDFWRYLQMANSVQDDKISKARGWVCQSFLALFSKRWDLAQMLRKNAEGVLSPQDIYLKCLKAAAEEGQEG